MFSEIDNKLGEISALVNNGGVSGGKKSIAEIDFRYLQEVYSANVFGTFICCREALIRMKKNHSGSIVNVSSLSGKSAGFNMSAYSSSKAAINNFTIGFSREAAEFNIRVNAVAPGVIDTDTHHGISEERLSHLKNSIPLKRIGTAKEVAESILWLLSEKSSYVTGSILEITGGK
jgi:NAD(P)-dependent dehydrogenase (short-subunit alcohol dehydrogenase family)